MRIWITILILFLLLGCRIEQKLCPHYQSAFVYHQNDRLTRTHYYNPDPIRSMPVTASAGSDIILPPKDGQWQASDASKGPLLPPAAKVKKNKYLVVKQKSKRKHLKAMRTIPQKPVYHEPDSLTLALRLEADSLARLDSTYRITLLKERYNMEQDYYNWYLRDILVFPDARIAIEMDSDAKGDIEEEKPAKIRRRDRKRMAADSVDTQLLEGEEVLEKRRKRRRSNRKQKRKNEENEESLNDSEDSQSVDNQ